MVIENAVKADAQSILEMQKQAYLSEAELYNDYRIAPLVESLAEVEKDFDCKNILKASESGKIVGSVRAVATNGTCYIGRLCVLPEWQNHGVGTRLLERIEALFPDCNRYELFTGFKSEKNLHFYQKSGYQIYKTETINCNLSMVFLEKIISES